jgi:WD40 repeat protein
MSISLLASLPTPGPVSTVSFGRAPSTLLAGSDDGSVRLYDLDTRKVIKAARGLPQDVSSIVLASTTKKTSPADQHHGHVWLASGNKVR